MPKFFMMNSGINGDTVTLQGKDAAHLYLSLRAKQGDNIVICDGEGIDYNCVILYISQHEVKLQISDKYPTDTEPAIKITLFQAIPKSGKMEYIIQKCVESGVYDIYPVLTERTVVKPNDSAGKKIIRYNSISETAAKQSMRGIVPKIHPIMTLKDAVDAAVKLEQAFVPYENENDLHIRDYLKKGISGTVGIFIGPEGGFSPNEIEMLSNSGIMSVSLGKRILRTETAGLYSLIITLYEGEMTVG